MSFQTGNIAILGKANVGKSSLLNRLVGQKIAAVTSKPQTTRTRISGIISEPEYQIVLFDTPGYHHPKKALNKHMMREAMAATHDADIFIILASTDYPWSQLDDEIYALCKKTRLPIFLVLNKADLCKKGRLLPMMEDISNRCDGQPVIPISVKHDDGVEELHRLILQKLAPGEPRFPEDQPTDQSVKDLAAELIREKLFEATQQEIPYSLAVQIERFKEPELPSQVTEIDATIWVERKSQKPIIIGKQGLMLKKIGQAARKDIEALLGSKVYLSLYVKIAKDWTENPRKRKELGYA